MKNLWRNMFLVALAAGVLPACGHLHKVEDVKIDAEVVTAKAEITSPEVNKGDTVSVYTTSCKKIFTGRHGFKNRCRDTVVGKAEVLDVLEDEHSLLQAQDGLILDDSMRVESIN
ncbi:MAG: hypothetical protein KF681_08765 [Bdellovibrionaceae bacterium]|nr:hypothetical protein [Pseudobdellovibrionaceae bacterium]